MIPKLARSVSRLVVVAREMVDEIRRKLDRVSCLDELTPEFLEQDLRDVPDIGSVESAKGSYLYPADKLGGKRPRNDDSVYSRIFGLAFFAPPDENPMPPERIFSRASDPTLEVMTIAEFLPLTTSPLESVNSPSSV